MTKIEELEAQLKEMREQMTKIEYEIECEKSKPIVRATHSDVYYHVGQDSKCGFHVETTSETNHSYDRRMFEKGNYYLDKDEAQLVADMFNYVTFAKMFIRQNSKKKINWNSGDCKFYINFSHSAQCFIIDARISVYGGGVSFPTEELAHEFIDKHEEYLAFMKY